MRGIIIAAPPVLPTGMNKYGTNTNPNRKRPSSPFRRHLPVPSS
ncbi:hypothetical protein [Neisseria lactamica]|nr:hypothetical protein [Neisseria lactamica]